MQQDVLEIIGDAAFYQDEDGYLLYQSIPQDPLSEVQLQIIWEWSTANQYTDRFASAFCWMQKVICKFPQDEDVATEDAAYSSFLFYDLGIGLLKIRDRLGQLIERRMNAKQQ